MRFAGWAEVLLTTATAEAGGAVNAVLIGDHRNTLPSLPENWPVFSRGRFAQDSGVRTQVADYRCAIEIGGVRVEPGDLIFADQDGVLIIPQRVEREVIERALEKAKGEKVVRAAIEAGMSSTEAFRTFGIL